MPSSIYRRGVHEGFQWVVTKFPGWEGYNGYVCVPEDHPWMKEEYPENNVPFGEITFRDGRWLGFDTMHGGQYWPDHIEYLKRVGVPAESIHVFKKDWMGNPSLEMTKEHVLTWVIQLCIDAKDAYDS